MLLNSCVNKFTLKKLSRSAITVCVVVGAQVAALLRHIGFIGFAQIF